VKTTIYSRIKFYLLTAMLICGTILLIGCGEPKLSSNEQVKAFELAGPITPVVDIDQLLIAKNNRGAYTVGAGDVLELQMPTILTAVSPKLYDNQQQQVMPYLCRVSDNGIITLPIIGQINVKGQTQAQIENEIATAYCPKYVVVQPSVVCNVKEYSLKSVTVVGAVTQPGIYQLRSNEMSLVNALMKAGGILQSGASIITINNPLRSYVSPQANNEVRQFAELGTAVDGKNIENTEPAKDKTAFSALEVELVFKPDGNNPAQGTLVIQRGEKIIHTKRINTQNRDERAKYVKELQETIGAEQAYIVEKAIEQLAGQLSPTITTNQVSETETDLGGPDSTSTQPKQIEVSKEELLETANDLDNIGDKKQNVEKNKGFLKDNQEDTEIPADNIHNAESPETAEIINNSEDANDTKQDVEKKEVAAGDNPEAAETPSNNNIEIQTGDNVKNAAPTEPVETVNNLEDTNDKIQDIKNNENAETPADNKIESQITDIAQSEKSDEPDKITNESDAISDRTQDYAKNEKTESYSQEVGKTPIDNHIEPQVAEEANKEEISKPVEIKQQPAPTRTDAAEAIVLPVKGLNIPFADAPLMEGDLIEVKRLNPAVFTVIGLAKNDGVFPYPPEIEYNLMQAIGFAGGVDLIADPRFVTVYRQDAKGEIVSAVFRIDNKFMAKSCNVKIKPGDVISIDVTPRTRRNVLLNQIVRLNFGVFISPRILDNNK